MCKNTAFILVVAFFQLGQAQAQDGTDRVAKSLPKWAELPRAKSDYLPKGCQWVQFPNEEVGRIYLAEKTETGWRAKRDSYGFWNASSLADCRICWARGKVALPTDQPLLLRVTAKDLSFLESIEANLFVAIEAGSAGRTPGKLKQLYLKRLLQTGAEQIELQGYGGLAIDPQLEALAATHGLKFLTSNTNREIGPLLAKGSSLVRIEAIAPLAAWWEGQASIEAMHLDMASGGYRPASAKFEHPSLRVAGTMPKLRELSVKYWAYPINAGRLGPLVELTDLDAIDLELPSEIGKSLDRDGVLALNKINNLRRLTFHAISPDAYPLFKHMAVREMNGRADADLARELARIPTLTGFPSIPATPESLEPLTNRNNIEVLQIRDVTEALSPVVERIIRANQGLRHLTLHKGELNEGMLSAIAGCSKLEYLELRGGRLTGDFKGRLPALRQLRLIRLDAEQPVAINVQCPNLRVVTLPNRWDWATVGTLKNCPKLERLTLPSVPMFAKIQVDRSFVSLLAGMPKLWDMNAPTIHVASEDIPLLAARTGLVRVDIAGKLTAKDLLPLRDCNSLRQLRVRSSELSLEDAKHLRKVFANVNLRVRK